ncbi:MAG: hypothetical protein H6799_00190 [Candidatus Nomurabacteria bacterium]|nr:MAG: hypothetical protein H6799_00190 [Candidatus Nomurabacteria bacterium]HRV76146.1 hypothetical protein [Candidatus Saccharimonadales bacterium]
MKTNNSIASIIKKDNQKKRALIALITLAALASIFQIRSLVKYGTFFGVKVRENDKSSITAKEGKASSGSLAVDTNKLSDGSKNVACKVLEQDALSALRKKEFKQTGGLKPDEEKPLTSTCLYTYRGTDGGYEMLSVLLREKNDVDSASKSLQAVKQGDVSVSISDIGDEAYFNKSSNQLTFRKDKQVITLTFSSNNTEINVADVVIKVARSIM